MPNLVVTNACNLRCPFCFASEYRTDDGGAAIVHMSVAEFRRLVAFSAVDTVRFCGGEPALHPHFEELLHVALEVPQRRVFLMSNGLWPEAARRAIETLPAVDHERITYLLNVLGSGSYTEPQHRQLERTLSTVDSERVTLALTVYEPQVDADFILDLARRYGVRHLRYSVAAPTVTDARSWAVEPERDFRALAAAVHGLVLRARRQGLHVHSDCGYIPPCKFTEEQLVDLGLTGVAEQREAFHCSGPVDIGPGGEAWRCYGLYSVMRANAGEFSHGSELSAHFERRTQALADRFMFDACEDCDHRARGTCGGGCHAFRAVRSLKHQGDDSSVAVADDRALLAAVPRLDPDRLRILRRGNEPVAMLREADGAWVEQSLLPVELALLTACDGVRSLAAAAAAAAAVAELRGSTESSLETRAARLLRGLLDQGAVQLEAGTID